MQDILDIKTILTMDKAMDSNKTLLKIQLCQYLHFIKEKIIKEYQYFYEVLKNNGINISKSDACFAMRLFKLAEKHPRIENINFPLRRLKAQFLIITEIFLQEQEHWKQN